MTRIQIRTLKLWQFILVAAVFFSQQGFSETHEHHAKHNMVIYGASEVYASHIVYKVPHNYEVIVRVKFPVAVQEKYNAARLKHPGDTFIFLLDSSDISAIQTADHLSGVLFSRDGKGQRSEIEAALTLGKGSFEVIYFEELPLSLAAD